MNEMHDCKIKRKETKKCITAYCVVIRDEDHEILFNMPVMYCNTG